MSTRLDRDRSVLVLVDYQQRLMPAIADSEQVLDRAVLLAEAAELLGVPVIGTAQTPDKLGPNVDPIARRCAQVLDKTEFGAADVLRDPLRAARADDGAVGGPPGGTGSVTQVVVAGCEAHVCLLQTALGLLGRDGSDAAVEVWVVADACGSRHPVDRELALRQLAACGIPLLAAETVVFEWLRTSADPAFRAVSALVKGRTPHAP